MLTQLSIRLAGLLLIAPFALVAAPPAGAAPGTDFSVTITYDPVFGVGWSASSTALTCSLGAVPAPQFQVTCDDPSGTYTMCGAPVASADISAIDGTFTVTTSPCTTGALASCTAYTSTSGFSTGGGCSNGVDPTLAGTTLPFVCTINPSAGTYVDYMATCGAVIW